MNSHTVCGFWPHRGEFAASVIDTEGRLHRVALAPDEERDYWAFLSDLERHHGLDLHLVLPEPLLRRHPLASLARARGMTVLVAPYRLAEAIAAVAYSRFNPHRLATILARLPGSRFRGHLQLLPPRDPRQLQLL